jgi:hypothetical protein
MNKNMQLTRNNINELEQVVYKYRKFFSKWMEEIVSNTTKDNMQDMDQ